MSGCYLNFALLRHTDHEYVLQLTDLMRAWPFSIHGRTLNMSIEMPDADRCAFCDYLGGERPYTILLTTALSAVLVTREQRGIGHLLVIPRVHRDTILNVTDEEAADLGVLVKRMARAIDAAYNQPGIAVWQNNGVPAHQSIGHVHFHVAGTVAGGGTKWGDVDELTVTQTDAIARKLQHGLKNI